MKRRQRPQQQIERRQSAHCAIVGSCPTIKIAVEPRGKGGYPNTHKHTGETRKTAEGQIASASAPLVAEFCSPRFDPHRANDNSSSSNGLVCPDQGNRHERGNVSRSYQSQDGSSYCRHQTNIRDDSARAVTPTGSRRRSRGRYLVHFECSESHAQQYIVLVQQQGNNSNNASTKCSVCIQRQSPHYH